MKDERDNLPEPHPTMPEWARPMWNLLALVHQGNVEARREAEAVRIRVWNLENEQLAINAKIRELAGMVRDLQRNTIPSPPPDPEEQTSPLIRVPETDGDPGPGI